MSTINWQNRLLRLGRRSLSSFTAPWQEKICFLHIPKCGGNSVIEALHGACPVLQKANWIDVINTRIDAAKRFGGNANDYHEDGEKAQQLFDLRAEYLRQAVTSGDQIISGHFLFDEAAYAAQTHQWVSLVREPISRMTSHYREECHSGFINQPFTDYLRSPMAWNHATVLTRYFSGRAHIKPENLDEASRVAKQNLGKFSLIGDVADMPKFQSDVSAFIGRPIAIGHRRTASHPTPEISTEDEGNLNALCTADILLYEAIRSRDWSRA